MNDWTARRNDSESGSLRKDGRHDRPSGRLGGFRMTGLDVGTLLASMRGATR